MSNLLFLANIEPSPNVVLFAVIFFVAIVGSIIATIAIVRITKQNTELTENANIAFENEKRLANMLDETYDALYLSNSEMMAKNESGCFNNAIKRNRKILTDNMPENRNL
jgi:hypothetical protein